MRTATLLALLAIAAFHLACLSPRLSFLMLPFILLLTHLARTHGPRAAFYLALAIALACYAPHLYFFLGIFGFFALALWVVLAIPLALFALLVNRSHQLFAPALAFAAIPFLFTGLEFARAELYYLRFAWLTPGLAFANSPLTQTLGVYGIGFLLAACAALLLALPRKLSVPIAAGLLVALGFFGQPAPPVAGTGATIRITGIQLEMASEAELIAALDRAFTQYPDTDLFILPEYSLVSPPTPSLKDWCMRHHRHLVVGGKEPARSSFGGPSRAVTPFYNTAFVVGPAGEIVFSRPNRCRSSSLSTVFPRRSKESGGPPGATWAFSSATTSPTRAWSTPWCGRERRCCWFPRWMPNPGAVISTNCTPGSRPPGPRSIAFPSPASHRRASRNSSRPAAMSSAPFPGQGEILSAQLPVASSARLPPDRYLAPASTLIALLLISAMSIVHFATRRRLKTASQVSLPAYPNPGARMPPGSVAGPWASGE